MSPSSRIKVSACLIVKNESPHLRNCLESIKDKVDEICIVDTGSTDDSPNIARNFADKFEIFTACNDSHGRIKSFSEARNYCLSLASYDYIFWMDGDDILDSSERICDIICDFDSSPSFQIMAPYEYSRDSYGKVNCLLYRERIVYPKHEFQWHGEVHETLFADHGRALTFHTDRFKIIHRPFSHMKDIETGRNLRIFENMSIGDMTPRDIFYYGCELKDNNQFEKAISILKKYRKLSVWPEEKYSAGIKIAECFLALEDFDNAINYYLSDEINDRYESCFGACKTFYFWARKCGNDIDNSYRMGRWNSCIEYGEKALELPIPTSSIIHDPSSREIEIYRYLNVAYYETGDLNSALFSVNSALKNSPNDPDLMLNRSLYENQLFPVFYKLIAERIHKDGDFRRLNYLVKSSSGSLKDELESIYSNVLPLHIIFYVGDSVEPWNPVVANRGLGGSEVALMEVAKRLSGLGHHVTVFGNCPHDFSGVFDNVSYVDYRNMRKIDCDVFISSRRPEVFDFDIKSKLNILWIHDIHCGDSLTMERSMKIDKFFCLSSWHKDFFLDSYKFIHRNRVEKTRNGIDLNRFSSPVVRDPNRVVYGSSPDRGLEVLLLSWPRIKKECPDASLHIYYGFDNWEKYAIGDHGQLKLIEKLKFIIESLTCFDVHLHGRVSQEELAREYLKSGVWAYPTWFSETSCVTAMEAQVSGLYSITSPVAALPETLGDNAVFIEGDWLSHEYREKFIENVIHFIKNSSNGEREKIMQKARDRFSWDSLVQEWVSLFGIFIKEKKESIVFPYRSAL